jgi:hypothetical protein
MEMSIEAKRRALLELRLRQRQAETAEQERITAIPRQGRLPCSYQQEGLWFLHQFDPNLPVYHIPIAVRLRGRLDVGALRTVLTTLVARHECLRTRFEDEDGLPEVVIDPAPEAWLTPIVTLSDDEVSNWIHRQAYRAFDLQTGPLFRSSLARIRPDEHVLLLVAHHIVNDGWSMSVLTRELSELYGAAVGAKPAPELAELTVQAVDYAAWQREWLASGQAQEHIDYWRKALENLQKLNFPADRLRPEETTGAGALLRRALSGELMGAVRGLARREQVSLLTVLLAGFLTVLHRYTGQDDLAVGSVFSGRTRTEVEPVVGFFANAVVLRTSLAGDPSFSELIRRCHDTVLGAATHQDVPFGLVVDTLKPARIAGGNPLFEVSLTSQPTGASGEGFGLDGIAVDELEINGDRARFDLAAIVAERADGGLDLMIEYSVELFDGGRMERLAEHFSDVLAQMTADTGVRISQCDVLPEAESLG